MAHNQFSIVSAAFAIAERLRSTGKINMIVRNSHLVEGTDQIAGPNGGSGGLADGCAGGDMLEPACTTSEGGLPNFGNTLDFRLSEHFSLKKKSCGKQTNN